MARSALPDGGLASPAPAPGAVTKEDGEEREDEAAGRIGHLQAECSSYMGLALADGSGKDADP